MADPIADRIEPLASQGRSHRRTTSDEVFTVVEQVVEAVSTQLVELVDIAGVVAAVDVDGLIKRVDLNDIISRVDINNLIERVDVDEIIQRVDARP